MEAEGTQLNSSDSSESSNSDSSSEDRKKKKSIPRRGGKKRRERRNLGREKMLGQADKGVYLKLEKSYMQAIHILKHTLF